jgi:hypothetical protein
MTNDDIIRLAIEHTINGLKFNEDGLLRFAKLVAQHEREACAKVCDNRVTAYQYATDVWAQEHINEARHLAKAIRARGQA